jgi:probable rRNA maturation factor
MTEAREKLVEITVSNRQRGIPINVAALEEFGRRALQACRETAGFRMLWSDDVAVITISDRRMAELHERFMNIAGTTDVITFQHGEIFISAETARRNARRFRNSLARELQLYLVHGLLHLHGFDDRTPEDARKMDLLQDSIMRKASKKRPRDV